MNLQPQPSTIMQEVLQNGNIPVAGKTGMMTGAGGVVPPVLLEESRVPKFYHEAIVACGATTSTMLPHTALVYNMMVTSGLPRPALSYIWSAVNRSLPGQLTRAEFYSCLALIALAQKGESIAALSTLSQLPIPHLQTAQIVSQQGPMTMVAGQGQSQQQPQRTAQPQRAASSASRFIPTSLLSKFRAEPKREVDLIADFANSSQQAPASVGEEIKSETIRVETSVAKTESVPSGPNYDLSDVDWNNAGSSFSDLTTDVDKNPSPVPQCSIKQSNWEEAVRAAAKLFQDCENSIGKSRDDILAEVFETEKGTLYLKSLFAISTIVSRIVKTSAGSLPKQVEQDARICLKTWAKYQKFYRAREEVEEGHLRTPTICPICQDAIKNSAVEFGTRTYHSTCANLWVNCVRSVLP